MKHFFIDISYTVPIEQIIPATERHRAYLKSGYELGMLLFSGPKVPRTGGILFARAPDRETVEHFIAGDPFKKENLAEYTIQEMLPMTRQAIVEEWFSEEQ